MRLALKRFDEAACTPFAVLAMTLGIGMIPWCETVGLVYLSGALIAFGYGLGNPLLNALISKGAPGDVQGVVLGASQSAQSLCRILGPVTAGALFAAFDRDMPYYVGTMSAARSSSSPPSPRSESPEHEPAVGKPTPRSGGRRGRVSVRAAS